jgi:hypothetical protein
MTFGHLSQFTAEHRVEAMDLERGRVLVGKRHGAAHPYLIGENCNNELIHFAPASIAYTSLS